MQIWHHFGKIQKCAMVKKAFLDTCRIYCRVSRDFSKKPYYKTFRDLILLFRLFSIFRSPYLLHPKVVSYQWNLKNAFNHGNAFSLLKVIDGKVREPFFAISRAHFQWWQLLKRVWETDDSSCATIDYAAESLCEGEKQGNIPILW